MSLLKYSRNILPVIRVLSTQTQAKDVPIEYEKINMPIKAVKKKPHREAFMKNLFLAKFDTELLAFPEVLDTEQLNSLNEKLQQLTNSLSQLDLSSKKQILENVGQQLRRGLNIFGLQSSELVEGLELMETENCRVLEILSTSQSLATSLISHQCFGVNAIAKKGRPELVKKYLANLSNGVNIAAFCLLEHDNHDPLLMKTKATLSDDGQTWILNGSKSWVINGSQGDLFLVVAATHDDNSAAGQDRLSILVVEKAFGGITSSPCQPRGLEGADLCNITFENTPVPVGNILGEGADSINVITPLLTNLRLSTGPVCATLLHKLIGKFSDYCINTKHGEKYLSDTDFIRDQIAQVNMNLYAIESLTYVTAGLLDMYEDQDCNLEAAIVKVFSSEKCLESVQDCVKSLGSQAFMKDHWAHSMYDDAMGHILLNETNESLRIVIALLGLQHTGMELKDSVRKLRNPFFHPGFIMQKMFEQRRQKADDPKLHLDLESYLHPSLAFSARWLEYCVYRLQYAAESLLIRHGPDVVHQHMELKRLADVAIDIYAMFSVLTRASRSYCIGLRNADYEILIANAFCLNARDRVKEKVLEITRGPYGTNDVNYQKIANRAFKFNGYFSEHALTKNF